MLCGRCGVQCVRSILAIDWSTMDLWLRYGVVIAGWVFYVSEAHHRPLFAQGIAPSKLTPKELLRAHVQDFKLVRKR